MNIKKIILSFVFFLSIFAFNTSYISAKEGNPINVYIFHGETCPHCKQELKYLDSLSEKYNFTLKDYEVYFKKENQKLMERFGKAYKANFNAVPTVIIGYEYFVGADLEKTERLIKQYGSQSTYKDPYEIVLDYEKNKVVNQNIIDKIESQDKKDDKKMSIFGNLKLEEIGPVAFGVLLGLADGINPCMFGVLIFLLTYLISIGSKKKILFAGIIFVATTFVFYYSVMYGMHNLIFNVSAFLPYVGIFKVIIGVVALFLAALEIKDFFFYGKGLTLRIPSFAKPIIDLIGKQGTYLSAFLLAVFSSIVELPCTIGIPLTYIAATEKTVNIFISLLIYNLAFIVPLLVIITAVYLSSEKIKNGEKLGIGEEKYKKIMRLIAGLVLLVMGILLISGKI